MFFFSLLSFLCVFDVRDNMGLGDDMIGRITGLKTPGSGMLGVVCGILNFLLYGFGTIIAGAADNNMADVIIGVLQLVLPFIGWIWSILWGVLMIINCFDGAKSEAHSKSSDSKSSDSEKTPQ